MKSLLRASICLLGLIWAGLAEAVLMNPLAIEELSARAQLVVHGTVSSTTCQRDNAGRIYTRIELHVADVWKGKPPTNPLQIVQGGGTLGEQRTIISGQVEYRPGEEVVGF